MGIVDEDIVKVRSASDIVAVISGHTQLKRVGTRWSGLCPFHTEKSPSFSVNSAEGLYYCFGCRVSGDVITFVREMEHTDFVGAVEWLAAKAGIVLRYTDRDEGAARSKTRQLQELLERAVDWYHDRLMSSPDAAAARRYLRSRGFDADLVKEFRIGWAPDNWDELSRSLKASRLDLVDSGLAFVNKRDRLQDFFRARVLFPIFDVSGKPVAFGGRKLPDTEGPKYQNSRENVLYNKSRTLYALNWAKADIVTHGEAVVCEGYTDVVGFHRAGIARAVATCGTALTEDHLRTLSKFTKRIVLAYDADEAGQAAAERVYEWERRLELEVAVLSLPAGTDPDELARSAPEQLVAAVSEAKPFLGFRVDRVLRAADVSTPEGRARAAGRALEVIAEHPDPLVRDQYLMSVADVCRMDPSQLRQEAAVRPRRPPEQGRPVGQSRTARQNGSGGQNGSTESGTGSGERYPGDHGQGGDDGDPGPGGFGSVAAPVRPPRDGTETEALRLVLGLGADAPAEIAPFLFREGAPRRALEALLAERSLHAAMETVDPAAAELLARIVVEEATADPGDVVQRLVEAAATRALAALDADARLSDDPLSFAPLMGWLKLNLDALRGDEPSMEAVEQLLAWLEQEAGEVS